MVYATRRAETHRKPRGNRLPYRLHRHQHCHVHNSVPETWDTKWPEFSVCLRMYNANALVADSTNPLTVPHAWSPIHAGDPLPSCRLSTPSTPGVRAPLDATVMRAASLSQFSPVRNQSQEGDRTAFLCLLRRPCRPACFAFHLITKVFTSL